MNRTPASNSQSKKRKNTEKSLEQQNNLYRSFVEAANSVSNLYSQAESLRQKTAEDAYQTALERVYNFVASQPSAQQTGYISTDQLNQFLRQEMENCPKTLPQMSALPTMFGNVQNSRDGNDNNRF